jgi:hypothetical protein
MSAVELYDDGFLVPTERAHELARMVRLLSDVLGRTEGERSAMKLERDYARVLSYADLLIAADDLTDTDVLARVLDEEVTGQVTGSGDFIQSNYRVTVADLAARTGLSTSALKKACRENRLLAIKTPEGWLIDRDAADCFAVDHPLKEPVS